ncbi:small multi-drug export protein [Sulfurovum sp.]|uniref:small multi-drug export protein n=1 Tax=Sulfurovum sp. TaxID=1969726 RepID=UPI0025EA1121|nr:small multi-drug export protein [Sulfurovum sp.]
MKKISFFNYTEGNILMTGLLLLGLFLLLLLYCAFFSPANLQTLLSITAANIIFGRMAGLSIGIAARMHMIDLILFNFLIESIMVLLLYPLFARSWNRLEIITYKPLHDFFERSRSAAQKYQPYIQKYGIPGLIFFVFTPLAMTGPVVGSFIGYIIGFSHRKTLTSILLATLSAITLWVYLISHFKEILIAYSTSLNIGFLLIAAGMGIWYGIKKYLL